MMALVRGVIAASMRFASISAVSGSISTNTGFAPTRSIAIAVAMKVIGVVMTSSPWPMPAASSARCSAAVPELQPIACSSS